jgi:hypothetical protein
MVPADSSSAPAGSTSADRQFVDNRSARSRSSRSAQVVVHTGTNSLHKNHNPSRDARRLSSSSRLSPSRPREPPKSSWSISRESPHELIRRRLVKRPGHERLPCSDLTPQRRFRGKDLSLRIALPRRRIGPLSGNRVKTHESDASMRTTCDLVSQHPTCAKNSILLESSVADGDESARFD